MNYKQRGNPTYRKDIIRGLFDNKIHRILLENIGSEIVYELRDGDYHVKMTNAKTKYGFRGELRITALRCQIAIEMFKDGWNIKLKNIQSMKTSLEQRKQIFGDSNIDYIWTQETEKVSKLTIQLLREVNEII